MSVETVLIRTFALVLAAVGFALIGPVGILAGGTVGMLVGLLAAIVVGPEGDR